MPPRRLMSRTSATSAARSAPSRITTPHPRTTGRPEVRTLLAILGPGLIVMVGDNDAGAFGTYTQAGQNYGTHLLWTLLLLVPVLYVNQEMVLRLGAVTGVGHARLIFERFGRFWGAFSVIDLFMLNALTIVTEFIGITLGLDFFGIPKVPGRRIAAALFDGRGAVRGIPAVRAHSPRPRCSEPACWCRPRARAPAGQPDCARFRHAAACPLAQLSDVMLLVIAIVGTTVAPWQLFFQQCYVIDKRITPRFMRYEKADLWIGIAFVVIGAVAMISFCARRSPATRFRAIHRCAAASRPACPLCRPGTRGRALRPRADRCLHHRRRCGRTVNRVRDRRRFRDPPLAAPQPDGGQRLLRSFTALWLLAAALVLIPGSPLGLLTEAVQTLAGVLLPSARCFCCCCATTATSSGHG